MTAFLLTWNPQLWLEGDEWYSASMGRATADTPILTNWAVGVRTGGITPGDIAVLLRQGRERGVVALGRFTSAVYKAAHWNGSGNTANYADVAFEHIVPLDDRLRTENLVHRYPAVHWNYLQASGTEVPVDVERLLLEACRSHFSADERVVDLNARRASVRDRPAARLLSPGGQRPRAFPVLRASQDGFTVTPVVEQRRAFRHESQLVDRYCRMVAMRGRNCVRFEYPNGCQCDLYVVETDLLVEAKASASRDHVRMAIGQLMDYRRFHPGASIAVLTPTKPDEDVIDIIHSVGATAIWEEGSNFVGSRSSPAC
ncbi:MAG: hypothetical protein ACK5OX_06955 [Desertimonas sp.]